jgi:hypothetical protein
VTRRLQPETDGQHARHSRRRPRAEHKMSAVSPSCSRELCCGIVGDRLILPLGAASPRARSSDPHSPDGFHRSTDDRDGLRRTGKAFAARNSAHWPTAGQPGSGSPRLLPG